MNVLIDHIASLLTASVKTPRGIKSIFKGDNLYIPQASLPAIVISPESEDIVMSDNMNDQHVSRLAISLLVDARTYMNASADVPSGLYELVKIMQEEDTNGIKNDTIVSVLRRELFYDATYCEQVSDERIDYGFGQGRGYPTLEAVLTFTVYRKPYLRNV